MSTFFPAAVPERPERNQPWPTTPTRGTPARAHADAGARSSWVSAPPRGSRADEVLGLIGAALRGAGLDRRAPSPRWRPWTARRASRASCGRGAARGARRLVRRRRAGGGGGAARLGRRHWPRSAPRPWRRPPRSPAAANCSCRSGSRRRGRPAMATCAIVRRPPPPAAAGGRDARPTRSEEPCPSATTDVHDLRHHGDAEVRDDGGDADRPGGQRPRGHAAGLAARAHRRFAGRPRRLSGRAGGARGGGGAARACRWSGCC